MNSNKDNLSKWFNKSSLNDFRESMDSFLNESAKNFNSLFNQRQFKVNKYETKTEVVVNAILPGYKRSQIELGIIGNQFRITVDDTPIHEEKGNKPLYPNKEQSSPQKMERLVSLPFTISKTETKATYTDGILTITTPKKEPNARIIDIDQ